MEAPFPLPDATIRTTPSDFVVEEIPAYLPCGSGEHLYVTFTKQGLTTLDATDRIAEALSVDPRAAGFAGMKDRHAVTTQTASFPFPIARPLPDLGQITIPGITIERALRHNNKLKPGHLVGNRFTIVLRNVDHDAAPSVMARLREAGAIGVPNAFGPQRFGRDGNNPERALAWMSGKIRGPRDRREQRLLFSSLQSLIFNRVLEERVKAGTWASVLPGDVAKKSDTGGLFTVPADEAGLAEARERARTGAISATGPMFGAKMRSPEGEALAIEKAVFDAAFPDGLDMGALRHLGEGTRRVLRLAVSEMVVELESNPEDAVAPGGPPKVRIVTRFVLPKGGYATTVLGLACRLSDASVPPKRTEGNPAESSHDPCEAFDGESDSLQEG